MRQQRGLQQAAITADVRKACEQFGIALPLVSALEEPLHGIERPALVDLQVRVQIMCQR